MKYILGVLVFITTLYGIGYFSNTPDYMVIEGGTFDQDVYVFITKDTSMVREYSPNADFNSRACTVDEGGVTIVWFPSYPDEALLAHEMEHVTAITLARCGVPHIAETDEVYAYQLQYLINKFGNIK